ncbi:hypothetical protein LSAT2_000851 [Lamellibrachia satsuma]|nr:hypothetical protein LSAT2_000851 [Lamellibrachia satsuma]
MLSLNALLNTRRHDSLSNRGKVINGALTSGWKARAVTCYKVYQEPMSWMDALSVCRNSGGQLAKAEELNTNIYIGEEVNSAGGGIVEYWIGFSREGEVGYTGHWSDETKTDTVIGNWMANQPDDKSGMCVKVSNDTNKLYPWTMHWCGAKLPFVCQIHACLEGEFQCSNGNCIRSSLRKNGEDDCGDMSDEIGHEKSSWCLNVCQDMKCKVL